MDNYNLTAFGIAVIDKMTQRCLKCEKTFICARGKIARETSAGKHPDWKKLYQEVSQMEDYGMECDNMRLN